MRTVCFLYPRVSKNVRNLCKCLNHVCVSPGRLDLEVVKDLGVEKWEDNHLLQSWDVTRKSSNAIKPHLRRKGKEGKREGWRWEIMRCQKKKGSGWGGERRWWNKERTKVAAGCSVSLSECTTRLNSPTDRWPWDQCLPDLLLRSSCLCESPEDRLYAGRTDDTWQEEPTQTQSTKLGTMTDNTNSDNVMNYASDSCAKDWNRLKK